MFDYSFYFNRCLGLYHDFISHGYDSNFAIRNIRHYMNNLVNRYGSIVINGFLFDFESKVIDNGSNEI